MGRAFTEGIMTIPTELSVGSWINTEESWTRILEEETKRILNEDFGRRNERILDEDFGRGNGKNDR